jgi:hypothetical protein
MNILVPMWRAMLVAQATRRSRSSGGYVFCLSLIQDLAHEPKANPDRLEVSR